ncbi:TetR/AcrR family transcriptional regulator [Microbulbifer pacificus]|uniref:TetR/AcrR family transcriptional regulator n=1 Tax=Microbulbifer pacificus TaxID=407164 RepID=A0AAU0MZM6_9GAMM|nr:TetR/AcrR family transcriptional regulator [Microbulbifer pacificus]WOX05949.1 TetR/AcrR family transcriptional regulator [Microbulbifer pacificus]
MASKPNPTRRTQAERREDSIARLVQACIDCLVEKGYHQTSTLAVARSAGLSQGALFRHFDSRLTLLELTAITLSRRFIDNYRAQVDHLLGNGNEDVAVAIHALHQITRSPEQLAWFELQQAARTDTELRDVFRPVFLENRRENIALAKQLIPDIASRMPMMGELVQTLIQIFHGQTLDAHLEQNPEKDEQILALTINLAQLATSSLAKKS